MDFLQSGPDFRDRADPQEEEWLSLVSTRSQGSRYWILRQASRRKFRVKVRKLSAILEWSFFRSITRFHNISHRTLTL